MSKLPLVLLLGLGASACLMPPTGMALIQQTAQQFNFDTRFGRMEMAVEQISPKYLEEFQRRHRFWGSAVRVTDAEMMGARFKGDDDADVSVRVTWYRLEEGDLHMTVLKQRWHKHKMGWLLDGEERGDGDIGVLGEAVDVVMPDTPTKSAQFPTVRIGQD
jgi:hypothetical protein